jgi:formate hydrogenlyase subunit 3/multisubunit Na+/H+ antiporter MnhD subunit
MQTGSWRSIAMDTGPAFYLILVGFMINAAVPPLHAWLADAYPEATVTGAIFLSALTTKTAVYTLIRGYPGTELLVWLARVMALYGVVYAVLANDIRRLLAYHIISQVGYMVAGVGMGTAMALNGAASHAFTHILYKALLFMGAGAVIHMTGRSKLTELGGIYRWMPMDLRAVHGRRLLDLGLPAVQRLRQQDHGGRGGGAGSPRLDLADAVDGLGRHLPAHRAEAAVVHLPSARTPGCGRRRRR